MITHTVKYLDNREGLNIYDEVQSHRIPSGHPKVDELAELIPMEGVSCHCDRHALYRWGSRYALLYVGHSVFVDDFFKMDTNYRIDIVDPTGEREPEWAEFMVPWHVLPIRKETMRNADYRLHTLNLMAVAIVTLAEFPADGEVQLVIKKVDGEWVHP